jgi:hypothetical protein
MSMKYYYDTRERFQIPILQQLALVRTAKANASKLKILVALSFQHFKIFWIITTMTLTL